MKPAEYLDAAKSRLLLSSDYALAKKAGVPKQYISGMRAEKIGIPLDLAYWLAITLELDPAEVVADLEAQREKNPKRKEFWRSFLLRARTLAVFAVVTLALIFTAGVENEPAQAGGS